MKNDAVLDRLMNSPRVKNLGLKKETVESILKVYDSIVLDLLLENGYIGLDNGANIEVVRLIDRVHVLRGVQYKSHRRYKLKLTMENPLYEKIEEYYNKLEEDIL